MKSNTTASVSQEQLLEILEEVNLAAREGLNQIEAIAQCMKMILERPDRQDHLVSFAHMITTIRDMSQSTRGTIGYLISAEPGLNEIGTDELRIMFPAGPDGHLQGVH